jgi:hypothetical protein
VEGGCGASYVGWKDGPCGGMGGSLRTPISVSLMQNRITYQTFGLHWPVSHQASCLLLLSLLMQRSLEMGLGQPAVLEH